MTRQQHTTLRLPAELMTKVDQFRDRLDAGSPVKVTRADALRLLIAAGLKAEGIK